MMLWWRLWKLSREMRDRSMIVRERVIRELSRIDHPKARKLIAQALEDEYQDVRILAAETLADHADDASFEPLLGALENPSDSLPVRQAAQRGIIQLGPKHVSELIARLQDLSCNARPEIVGILSAWDDPKVIPALIDVTNDQDVTLRKEAIHALGKLRKPEALDTLIEALQDPRWNVRAEACEALSKSPDGKVPDAKAIEPLCKLLTDEKWTVRACVCKSLRHFDDPTIGDKILPLLTDTREEVKAAAATTLGKLGVPTAIQDLIAMLQDADWAETAVDAIQQIVENNAGNISAEDLQAIANLSNPQQNRYEVTSLDAVHTTAAPVSLAGQTEIDLSKLKEKVQAELSKR